MTTWQQNWLSTHLKLSSASTLQIHLRKLCQLHSSIKNQHEKYICKHSSHQWNYGRFSVSHPNYWGEESMSAFSFVEYVKYHVKERRASVINKFHTKAMTCLLQRKWIGQKESKDSTMIQTTYCMIDEKD